MLAGFCKVVITAPLGQVAFAGYNGRKFFPRGVVMDEYGHRHEIYARALVLEPDGNKDPGKVVCIVSTELFMVRHYWVDQVRLLAEKITSGKILAKNICIHATHSHQAPDSLGIYYPGHDFDGRYLDEAWLDALARQVAGAVYGAWKNRRPALMSVSEGMLEGRTVNRRDMGLFDTSFPRNPRTIDPQVPVIIIYETDGRPRLVLTSFATHPTFLSTFEEWAGEQVPFIEQEVKRAFGDAVDVMYFTGQAGDIIPGTDPDDHMQLVLNQVDKGLHPNQVPMLVNKRGGKIVISAITPLLARIDLGKEDLVNAIRTELDVEAREVAGDAIEIGAERDGSPVIRDVFTVVSRIAGARHTMKTTAEFARIFVAEVARVQKSLVPAKTNEIAIDREGIDVEIDDADMAEQYNVLISKSSPRTRPDGKLVVLSEVQGIRIGPAYIICVPSEPINEIGLRLKKLVKDQATKGSKSPGIDHVFLFELCNDGFGYVVPPFEHDASGYEVSIFCFGKHNGEIIENASLQLASRILGTTIEWQDVALPVYRQAPWPEQRQKAKDEWLKQQKGLDRR